MELLVAMSIFVVLVTIATGSFIQALRGERRVLALMTVTNNASLALEQMAREIRTGYLFNDASLVPTPVVCTAGGFNGEAGLVFKSRASGAINVVSYGLKTSGNGANILTRTQEDSLGTNSSNVTADNVNVGNLCFLVNQMNSRGDNDDRTACYPWRVTVLMTVNAFPAGSSVSPINLETTVSSRILPGEVPRSDKGGTAISNCSL